MKSKTRSKVWAILGTLVMILPLFLGLGSVKTNAADGEAASTEANVIIHKKKMTESPNPLIQNTGKEMKYFDQYEALPGVEFKAYDVTAAYYQEMEAEKNSDLVIAKLQWATYPGPYAAVAEGTTAADGSLTLPLLKKAKDAEGNEKDAVYVIVETEQGNVQRSANMVLSFPVYAMDDQGEYTDEKLTDIHLYPKNIVNVGEVKIQKVGTDGQDLSGAEFTLQYTGAITAYTDKFVQSKDADDKTGYAEFGDNKATLTTEDGKLDVTGLPDGTYLLTETAAPTGYTQDGQETEFSFEIKDGKVVALDQDVFEVSGYDYGNPTSGAGINQDVEKDDATNLAIENLLALGGIDFEKQDQYSKKALDGAVFNIVKDEDGADFLYVNESATEGYKYAWKSEVDADNLEGYTLVEETSKDGKFSFADLKQGTYHLYEKTAPAGYVLPENQVVASFEITADTKVDDKIDQTVENLPKGHLPGTGGNGIVYIIAVGAALVAGAAFYFVKRNKNYEA